MAVFWTSFRIFNDQTYDDRYSDFTGAVKSHASMIWEETTSFFVFESDSDIATISADLKKNIKTDRDLFLIRQMDSKSAYICGRNDDQDIFKLMPYLKKL